MPRPSQIFKFGFIPVLLFLLAINLRYFNMSPTRSLATREQVEIQDYMKFKNPELANKVLTHLNVYESVTAKYFPEKEPKYGDYYYALIDDNEYCKNHQAWFTKNAESVFLQKNVFTNYPTNSLIRELVIRKFGNDMHPNIDFNSNKNKDNKNISIHNLRTDTNLIVVHGMPHIFKELGKSFACISQEYNKIPGHEGINRKDNLARSVTRYTESYASRPQCFNNTKFFPETWSLNNKTQCQQFFKKFNSKEYFLERAQKGIVYIRKLGNGAHQAKGVQPVTIEEERSIRKLYKNGSNCGQVNKSYLIQTYVYNPLLLNGHKFDFRIYMVIASTNPTMAYYHDGFLRVSLHPYDINSKDKSVLLTNTALSANIFEIAKKEGHYQGLTEEELRNFQMWNFERLQAYLLEQGRITDKNWLNNYLRPEFKKAMIHLVRMVSDALLKRSQVYELFGVDFMLDDNLNLWFIECNSGPVLSGSSKEKEIFVTKMLVDQFEIVSGLLKSRMKRVIQYVNGIIEENQVNRLPGGAIEIKDLEIKQKEFKKLIENRFEREYELSWNNGFSKIVDDNYEGVERYSGLISEECL